MTEKKIYLDIKGVLKDSNISLKEHAKNCEVSRQTLHSYQTEENTVLKVISKTIKDTNCKLTDLIKFK